MSLSWGSYLFGDCGLGGDKMAEFESILAQPGLLGDLICVEGDCESGKLGINALMATWEQHKGNPKVAAFATAVTALKKSYDEAQGSWVRHIPFSPTCCQIKEIGRQAGIIGGQLAQAVGSVPLPSQPESSGLSAAIKTALIYAAVAGGGYLLYRRNRNQKGGRLLAAAR